MKTACTRKRLMLSLICISLAPASAALGQQGEVFSTNTNDYNHAEEVDARRAKAKQQALEQQKEAEQNQDNNSIIFTGKPINRKRRPDPVFASERKKNGGYVPDNRRPGFDPSGGTLYQGRVGENKFTPPSPAVPTYASHSLFQIHDQRAP